MKISNPILFVEINETNYIFSAGVFDESQKLQAKEIIITPNDDIKEGKFFNFSNINLVFKKNIQTIENQLNYVFKEAIVILDSLEYFCTNISGFKKLNGSQILKDNISYILNTLKLAVNESEKDKTIMHMFNSKSVLDGLDIENLPIGLFGDFYSHELTFFLIKNNDLKNLKNIFYKNNLKIKKILLKDFVEGADLIKQNNDTETFFKIKVNKTTTNLNFFEKSSFRFAQNFSFGSNIILNDISKVCSISHEMIQKILSSNSLNNINSDNDLIEKEYFVKSNYRKIRKKLIMEIVDARIEEICKIVLNKNINIQSFLNNYKGKVYITISDNIITKNFRENLNTFFLTNKNFETKFIHMIEPKEKMLSINSVADLTFYGWRKEAIPITQTKSSLITRIFKSLFD